MNATVDGMTGWDLGVGTTSNGYGDARPAPGGDNGRNRRDDDDRGPATGDFPPIVE